ncbi:hypothetical protein E2320_020224, partial [Naja naja]
MLIVSCVISI